MNIPTNESTDESRTTKIREHNDLARSEINISGHLKSIYCKVVRTKGVGDRFQDQLSTIMKLVADYSDFSPDSDPHNEHDMGFFVHDGIKMMWKFDYYDKSFEYASPDASDPNITRRVLTVLLAEEF